MAKIGSPESEYKVKHGRISQVRHQNVNSQEWDHYFLAFAASEAQERPHSQRQRKYQSLEFKGKDQHAGTLESWKFWS